MTDGSRKPPLAPSLLEAPSDDVDETLKRRVEITNEYGLHLRPVDLFVRLALTFQSEIRVRHNGHDINGKSILDLLGLGAPQGTVLELIAKGPDAAAALDALSQLVVSSRFNNPEDQATEDKD
jgi:phosphocarrier protein HPr